MTVPRLCSFALVLCASTAFCAKDFQRDIQPIFEERCLDCHDAETRKGGLALDTHYAAHQLTDSGERLLVPGSPEKSLLLRLITAHSTKERMPPKGKPLQPQQIEALREWIAEGAPWPDDGWRPKKHWAYEAPKLPSLPPLGQGRNEIDAFLNARLLSQNIQANPDADPAIQLRRVFLDLTGLPPSVEEVDAFLADPSDAAYERVVDALLGRPQFGERWARPWLDLARYADSEGYQRDVLRSMWPWRDWVIDALNADMPYDEFTVQQLAGDLLPEATLSQKIATGFQRNAPLNLEAGTDPAEDHYKQVVDRVNTLGAVWLGSTVACAQCHNHKYDPISIAEYYRLFAFFNQSPMESRRVAGNSGSVLYSGVDLRIPSTPEVVRRRAPLEKALHESMEAFRGHLRGRIEEWLQDAVRLAKLPMNVREILQMPEDERSLEDYKLLEKEVFRQDNTLEALLATASKARIAYEPLADPTTRVMRELETPRPTAIARRGDFLSEGETVSPGVPAIFSGIPEGLPANRLGLARWLVDGKHPLTARVAVNRWWAELFGRGIVPTLEEFGAQGEPPSHPELLDWLAVTFVEKDQWSMKRFLRRIVLSSAYRRSAAIQPQAQELDAPNQWLWRHPGHRLDAETIRDNALAVGGLLSFRKGGAPVYPPQPEGVWRKAAGAGPGAYVVSSGSDRYRRGIYTIWKRNGHYPAFAMFDAPDRASCTLQRSRSNTPLQALVLLNDEAYAEMARALARRMASEFAGSVEDRLVRGFRTVLARHPTEAEIGALKKAFELGAAAGKDTGEGFVDVATILLNLHETIHRG